MNVIGQYIEGVNEFVTFLLQRLNIIDVSAECITPCLSEFAAAIEEQCCKQRLIGFGLQVRCHTAYMSLFRHLMPPLVAEFR